MDAYKPSSLNNDSVSSDNVTFVSFGDDDDESLLIPDQDDSLLSDISEVPALEILKRQVSNNGTPISEMPSQPLDAPSPSYEYQQRAMYGSAGLHDNGDAATPTRRLIYCIHGKPSGCCMVTEGQIIERNIEASPPNSDRDPNEITEHCHRTRHVKVDQIARKKLIIASILCLVFMVGEIIGGYLSSSLAIATDAAHLLTDFASFMISLFSLWVASRPPTRTMSFGWYRAEVIGALTSVLMIWVVTGILVYLAILRIIHKDFEINATIMLITSAVGVAVNLVMGLTLHQHGHSHGGGSSHGHSHEGDSHSTDVERNSDGTPKSQVNINVRAAFIHVVGDFIQSLGVLIAALIIYFKPTWIIVDPICTFLFSALVLATTFAILRDTLMVLMEGMPKGVDFSDVMNTFMQIEGVVKVHNLRIWALSLNKTALSAHLAIRPGIVPQNVLRLASQNIHERFNFFEMTLQIEEFDLHMEDCTQCKEPEN